MVLVCGLGTVVADIPEGIQVGIQLVGVVGGRAVVADVADTVRIAIDGDQERSQPTYNVRWVGSSNAHCIRRVDAEIHQRLANQRAITPDAIEVFIEV